ncbi:PEPxxWA-CTERM sorting domain-containing protein [Sphingomonas glaciei]|uniref:PEPxxWA-CTERM sorting domain-containing protein n=1 Tax=Sphingomonas glaciei TaxID=2938948 RepID=A0ABY5MUY0_9SPHN|nr:PEPxxWA-CTERM sorting domain-containing protein [Sphingomonas glaciei]UUR06948.1 PEPxxWA-CTERM sorting domain-containing protein [Sphingomonas glaciei]
MKILKTLAATSALAVAVATPASAAITVTASPGAVQPAENVLANTSATGTTVTGNTNQTNTSVSITSNERITSTTSNGQSRFSAADGSALDQATIALTAGGTLTSAEFNLFNAAADTSSVSIIVNGVAQIFNIGNGQNFFGFSATGGDTIRSIAFDTNGSGVVDLRQVRLGGVAAAVPEPGTWALMLVGFGAVGVSMRRRRTTHIAQFA